MDIGNTLTLNKTITRLDQLLDHRSEEYPDKVAIKHGLKKYSYKSVSAISTQLALYFKDQGIDHGDVVGVALDRSPELIIILLAIIKSGATYLPIDNKLPVNRINYMLNDSGAKFLIASKHFHIENQPHLQVIFLEDALGSYAAYDVDDYEFIHKQDSIAYILYTSGSTGDPKGVQVKHSGLLNLLLSVQQEPGADSSDIVLATTTISFDIAALEIFLPLISGARLVLADHDVVRDGRLLIEIARNEKVTLMQGTPIMWLNMLESGWAEPLNIKIISGGEAMSRELAKGLLPRCKSLWNMYGPTETTIYSTIKRVTAEDNIITIGKPMLNTQVYILDEDENEVLPGETGEIYIGGAGVALGYINKPELTADKFIEDKFIQSGGKIYKSGDLGRILDNGDIECLGRIDFQIKIRGYRVETEEIEYQLKQLENVKEALVVLFHDFLGHTHLAAYVVLKNPKENSLDSQRFTAWKDGLKKMLPGYMVPDVFKVIEAIPRLINGKIDRNALPDPIIRDSVSNEFECPNTKAEIFLTDICLNNIALEKIGISDNFFELGIDSLVAVQIMVQIEQQFCRRLPLSTLIQYPTIKMLAAFLDQKTPDSSYKSLVPIQPKGNKIPLYIVHGLGLNILNLYGMVSNMKKDQPVYGIQPLGLDGESKPLDKMEDVARFYVSEIVEHNPTGPYAIAGYSFGGFIAYEMVKQLKAAGKEVVMLGMFDSNIQLFDKQYPLLKKIGTKIKRQVSKAMFRAHTLTMYPVSTLKYLSSYYSKKFDYYLNKAGIKKVYNPDKLPEFMLKIVQKMQTALDNYTFEPLDVRIELFKADERMYHVDDRELLGWGNYALKGVNINPVPGDHKHMFTPPNDKILAGVLQNKLDTFNNPKTAHK